MEQAKSDVLSYLSEFYISRPPASSLEHVRSLINEHDIVLFGKVGCGFCQKAKDALQTHAPNNHFIDNISKNREKYTAPQERELKAAVAHIAGIYDMTFPQIFIKGRYHGGADDLLRLIEENGLKGELDGSRAVLKEGERAEHYGPLKERNDRPDLFTIPKLHGDGVWYPKKQFWWFFQFSFYGNLMRPISFLQILFFILPCFLLLEVEPQSPIIVPLMWLFVADLVAFVLLGPSPFSITGVMSQYFMWKNRGNATSTTPYKVVFAAYLFTIVPSILDDEVLTDDSKRKFLLGKLGGYLLNSGLLAAFRF